MKNLTKKALAIFTIYVISLTLFAAYKVGALDSTYNFFENGIDFIIYDYTVNPHAVIIGVDENLSDLTVPNEVQGVIVTGISLYDEFNLETITIPTTITSINISNCLNIRAYNVETGNGNYCTMDGVIYDKNFKTLLFYPPAKADKSFTVPESVEIIGENDSLNNTFEYCTNLEEINFNEGLKEIKDMAFHGCKFEKLRFPDSLTKIGNCSFSDNFNLREIIVSENVEDSLFSFSGCNNLETVIFLKDDIQPPDYTSSIGEECMTCYNDFFEGCEATVNVYVSDSKVDVYKVISETWNTIDVQVFPLSSKPGKVFYGDVNFDGMVSLADVLMLQKSLLNFGNIKSWIAGDIDENNIVNVFDLILIKRMVIGN